ncbi:hypothetical protein ES703_11486 [subsurface metagenome]
MLSQLFMVELQFSFISKIGVGVDFIANFASRLCAGNRPDFHIAGFAATDPQIQLRAGANQYRTGRIEIKHIRRRVKHSQPLIDIQWLIRAGLGFRSAQDHL